MKLYKYYAIDECTNDEELMDYLDVLENNGKINWEKIDNYIKIDDVDLLEKDEKQLIAFLDAHDVFPESYDEDEETDDDDDTFIENDYDF